MPKPRFFRSGRSLFQRTVAAGMIRFELRRASNLHKQNLSVDRIAREKLAGHKGKVIWLTGLSGAGKSTIANAAETILHAQGFAPTSLMGTISGMAY